MSYVKKNKIISLCYKLHLTIVLSSDSVEDFIPEALPHCLVEDIVFPVGTLSAVLLTNTVSLRALINYETCCLAVQVPLSMIFYALGVW